MVNLPYSTLRLGDVYPDLAEYNGDLVDGATAANPGAQQSTDSAPAVTIVMILLVLVALRMVYWYFEER